MRGPRRQRLRFHTRIKMKPYYQDSAVIIYHGRCEEVLQCIEPVDMMISSPPYAGVESMWGKDFSRENVKEANRQLGLVWRYCMARIRPGCKMAINVNNTGRRPYVSNVAETYNLMPSEAEPLGEIIWHKGMGQNGTAWGSWCNPSDPALADQHEYILLFRKEGDRAK